jgi:triacylglycerol lipase
VRKSTNHRSSPGRVHIVLIPGFAGFDALGQLEYYAGVTPQFRGWKSAHSRNHKRQTVTLHYFDNFPTAAVATRATRLRNYLAKRIARGEFQPGDSVALVGHSTGGLDIRRMIWDLSIEIESNANSCFPVDGTLGSKYCPAAEEILSFIKHLVFLSVPQFGTNIANWVRAHQMEADLVVAQLRTSLEISQVPLLDQLQEMATGSVATATNLDLLEAIEDALKEAEVNLTAASLQAAMSQEAESELALFLRHIATDFSAISDLEARVAESDVSSPAHFNGSMREYEKRIWHDYRIQTKSYATLGHRPFKFKLNRPAPLWAPLNLLSYAKEESGRNYKASDIVYRTCYRACAGGPFEYPDIPDLPNPPSLTDDQGTTHKLQRWDNDGIVNTASMLWPDASDTVLINADHMDIVGHYKRTPAAEPSSSRRYDSYNLLQSGSGFDFKVFEKVWNGVFDFCVG